MSKLVKINIIRRRLTKALTKGVGSTNAGAWDSPIKDGEIKKILISRPNHRLGNLLLITPLIQEVQERFPNASIDLFVKGGLPFIIFKNYKNVVRILILPRKPFSDLSGYMKGWLRLLGRKYDLVINVDKNSSSGRLSTQFARGNRKIFGELLEEDFWKQEDRAHFAKGPVCTFRSHMQRLGFGVNYSDFPFLDLKLSEQELEKGKQQLKELGADGPKTVALFTYATGAKCYSEAWWEEFYEKLKSELPDYQFVEVLPIENISRLSFKLPSYYSKDVREIASFIANTALFIGADSGITHLASASGTPTIALFEVTSELKYRPYNANSTSLNTKNLEEKNLGEILQKALKAAPQ